MGQHVRLAGRGQQPHLGGREAPAIRHGDLAGPNVLPRRPDVPPFGNPSADPHLVGPGLRVLDGHDAVGSPRDDRAGVDANGLVPSHRGVRPVPDASPAHHPQLRRPLGRCCADVAGPARVAVHGGRSEFRQAQARHDVLRHHASEGLLEREVDGSEGLDPVENAGPGLVHREQPGGGAVLMEGFANGGSLALGHGSRV